MSESFLFSSRVRWSGWILGCSFRILHFQMFNQICLTFLFCWEKSQTNAMNVTHAGNLRIHDNMNPQIVCLSRCKVTLVAFVWFFSTVFPNICSNCLPQRMKSHTVHINSTFLHCVFSNVSSNCLPERMHNHIGCTCLTFLHCVFSNAGINGTLVKLKVEGVPNALCSYREYRVIGSWTNLQK